ncbi:unnamed protein product [Prunus brigantina]
MRTKNKCIEGGASHKGSRAPKTTLAKGTKGNSSVASSSSKKWKPAKRISGPMATGVFGVRVFKPRDEYIPYRHYADLREAEEQHRTPEGAKIKVANISPQPWSVRIPCWAAENESKLVRIPRGQDSLDLPLPDGVTHVTAEAATELLDLIAGLNAVLFSTAWQASIEIRRLRQENEILKNSSATTIASSGLVQHLLDDDAEHEFRTKFKYDVGRKGNTKLVIQEEHEEDEEEEEEEEDEDEDEEGDEEEVWIEDGDEDEDEDEDEDADEDGAATKGNPDAEQHSTYQKRKGEKSLRSRTPKRKKTK